jgi:hypothetical protein
MLSDSRTKNNGFYDALCARSWAHQQHTGLYDQERALAVRWGVSASMSNVEQESDDSTLDLRWTPPGRDAEETRLQTKIRRMPVIVSASAGSGLHAGRAGIKRGQSFISNGGQQHTSQRNMFASFTDKQKVVSNMWKRMSGVFDASALLQAVEVAPAEPLVGSNGLLTLSALEQAKKLNSDHKPHTCHLRYKCLCVRAHAHTHRARLRMPVVNNR